MDVHNTLFDGEPGWLAHTLARAGESLTPVTGTLADGTDIRRHDIGLLELTPPAGRNNPGAEALIVSAGIHGNETAPIEVLNALVQELLDGRWMLACPLLLILGNPPAMVAGERFLQVNLNRLFAGAHRQAAYQGNGEAERAARLEQYCEAFAHRHAGLALSHYDLHTAIRPSHREKFALYPHVPGRQLPSDQAGFLLEAEVPTLLLQHKAGTTFASHTSSNLGAQSFTVELGKVMPFGQNDLNRFAGIERALRRRFRGEPSPAPSGAGLTVFEVVHEVLNTGDGFEFHVPDDAPNFSEYAPGTVIWEDGQQQYRVGSVPESVVFPNRAVPVGQRVALMVRPRPD
ncbi:succinylglutamate desuccinylase [Marinobacter sp. C2H3]|uniref:succinylglutamate desuccinylase n=1 Tax=Marinobacter sp. C2H3 TaxID=3119003 RepID=UPI00300F0F12